jgi:hypothetical protein
MSHSLVAHMKHELEGRLRAQQVVVWYDEGRAFEPFVHGLLEEGVAASAAGSALKQVRLGTLDAHLFPCSGSLFEARFALEPLVAGERPEPVVVYVPGERPERSLSVLYELEVGGGDGAWAPALRFEARKLLRELGRPEAAIDDLLASPELRWADVEQLLSQHGDEAYPRLRAVFGGLSDLAVLAAWLASADYDEVLRKKDAVEELRRLVAEALGVTLAPELSLDIAGRVVARGALLAEFISDLDAEPPAALHAIAKPETKEQVRFACELAKHLRRHEPEGYERLANEVEEELALPTLAVDAEALGHVDTFRFEERALLAVAWRHVRAGEHEAAAKLVAGRAKSFWVDRAPDRQVKWQACGLMAQLLAALEGAQESLPKAPKSARGWVDAYCKEGGWAQVDRLHRQLEFRMTKLMAEPEEDLAFEGVRQQTEEWLQRSAEGFSTLLEEAELHVEGVLHQRDVYPQVVAPKKGRTAYLLVDALRFEMGFELKERLERDALELVLRPAIAALPSITPVGMAALLPEASADFHVVPGGKGELAAQIQGTHLPTVKERMAFFKARRPELKDVPLYRVLDDSLTKLGKDLADAPFVVVRSTEIDAAGEQDGGSLARQIMETVIANLELAIRKLAQVGIEHFVVVSDHGHQFTRKKDESQRTPSPGGKEIDLHRRCWAGHGGQTPPGCFRVSAAQLGYEGDLEFIFPRGVGVFKAGGGLDFHHGGVSLQELVIPVLTFRMPPKKAAAAGQTKVRVKNAPGAITNRLFPVDLVLELGGLFDTGKEVRVFLEAGGRQVGDLALAVDVEWDQTRSTCTLLPGQETKVIFQLQDDGVDKAKVVVRDADSDRTLGETKYIDVKLTM